MSPMIYKGFYSPLKKTPNGLYIVLSGSERGFNGCITLNSVNFSSKLIYSTAVNMISDPEAMINHAGKVWKQAKTANLKVKNHRGGHTRRRGKQPLTTINLTSE